MQSDCPPEKPCPLKEDKSLFVLPYFNQRILYVDKYLASLGSTIQNFVVNYSLVISYLQTCQIGINANH